MNYDSKIYVAGHTGLVGSAIVRHLKSHGYYNLILRTQNEMDARNQNAVNAFFESELPEYVFIAAARVGGILANNLYRADFMYDNLMIATNIIHAAHQASVKKLLFLGSSCIYPRLSPQPIKEEYFMTGPLEPTNEPYALAKIAGIGLCQAYQKQYNRNFISCMPTNLYGPADVFDQQKSHVIPALIKKMYEAKKENSNTCYVFGSGKPLREFLFVDDLADALIFLMQNYNESLPINIGSGQETSIAELANIIAQLIGYTGKIIFDPTKPDGAPRKLLDSSKINQLGWRAQTPLGKGLETTINWYIEQESKKQICQPLYRDWQTVNKTR